MEMEEPGESFMEWEEPVVVELGYEDDTDGICDDGSAAPF